MHSEQKIVKVTVTRAVQPVATSPIAISP